MTKCISRLPLQCPHAPDSALREEASSKNHYDRGGLGGGQEEGFLLQGQVLPPQGPPGRQKSDVAIAHRILLGIYHVIKDGVEFRDLGEDYLTQRNKSLKLFQLRKQAQSLGFNLVPQTT